MEGAGPGCPGPRQLIAEARQLRKQAESHGQYISRLTAEQQLAREDANVRASLDYARDVLGIVA